MKSIVKSIIIFIILLFPFIGSNAQNSLFGRIQVGTQSSTSPFEGASFEINIGTTIKGLEAGISLSNYCNRWGKSDMETIHIDRYDNYDITAISDNGDNVRYQNFGIYASVGYDLLSLIRRNKRHHFSPVIDLGYSHKTSYSKYENNMPGLNIIDLTAQTDSDFEMSLGCRYEFDITKNISAGAFYKIYLSVNEIDIIGLSLKYQLPLK